MGPGLEIFADNLRRVEERLLSEEGYDAVVLGGESNVTYITGLRAPSGPAIISRDCGPMLVIPLLDYDRVAATAPRGFEIYVAYRGGEEGIEPDVPKKYVIKNTVSGAIRELLEKCGAKKTGADLASMGYQLASMLKNMGVEDVSGRLSQLRMVKSSGELELIEKAVRVAEDAFRSLLERLGEGIREDEAAGLLFYEMLRRGAWYEAFPSIVAFYANTAYPHHTPTRLVLGKPGPVLVDWGAIVGGYRSDSTRTWWHGSPAPQKFREHLEAVIEAQGEVIDTIAPGVAAWEPDNAARRVLSRRGLSKYFIHGLGHGVGIDIHEAPYLRPGSKTVLEPGMVVTVEPGIYMTGLYGIRVEDLVVVTKTGARLLTRLPREIP